MVAQITRGLKKEIVQRLLNADDDLKIVVCTAVLSMGIDMADFEFVILDELPGTLEQFLQIAGILIRL